TSEGAKSPSTTKEVFLLASVLDFTPFTSFSTSFSTSVHLLQQLWTCSISSLATISSATLIGGILMSLLSGLPANPAFRTSSTAFWSDSLLLAVITVDSLPVSTLHFASGTFATAFSMAVWQPLQQMCMSVSVTLVSALSSAA